MRSIIQTQPSMLWKRYKLYLHYYLDNLEIIDTVFTYVIKYYCSLAYLETTDVGTGVNNNT